MAEKNKSKPLSQGKTEGLPVEGTVKKYNEQAGWGYIKPDVGEIDAFVHWHEVRAAGLEFLEEGQRVQFETVAQEGRDQPKVVRLQVLDAAQSGPAVNATLEIVPQPPSAEILTSKARGLTERHLWKWAFFQNRNDQLAYLASMALPETWSFSSAPSSKYPMPILFNYLQYTFAKLQDDQQVLYSDTGSLAAFNTGLVDRLYDSIIAVFDANSKGNPPWLFKGFCVPGQVGLGKMLVREFREIPSPPRYFENTMDLIYLHPEKEPHVEWRHVILDGIKRDRFPVEFLRDNCPTGITIPQRNTIKEIEWLEFLATLGERIETDNRILRNIKSQLEESLKATLKRVHWNFKTAIPMWFPTNRKMMLLLPMSITREDSVDLALVVEQTKHGNYLGHTVLPLHLAYMDARLVCRPDSDWLRPEVISAPEDPPNEAIMSE